MLDKAAAIRAINEQLLISQDEARERLQTLPERKAVLENKLIAEIENTPLNYTPLNEEQTKVLQDELAIAETSGRFGPLPHFNGFGEDHLPTIIEEVNKRKNITKFCYVPGWYAKPPISDKGLKYIADNLNDSIKDFGLTGHLMTDAGLKYLLSKKKIERLCIFGSRITDEGIKILAESPHLLELDIGGCYLLTEKSGEYLAQSSSLQELSLNHSLVFEKNRFFCHFARNKSLKRLEFNNVTTISDETAMAVSKIKSLTYLDIASCDHITDLAKNILFGTTERRKIESKEFAKGKCQILMGISKKEESLGPQSALLTFSKESHFDRNVFREIFQFCDDTSNEVLEVITKEKYIAKLRERMSTG